jgi:sugar diacid utilization regulator
VLTLEGLLSAPLDWTLGDRVLPNTPAVLGRVLLIEDLGRVNALETGTLAVLSRGAADAAGGYQFDVFMRHAVQRDVSAVLVRTSTRRSMTAEAIAARGGVAILEIGDEPDAGDVVEQLATLVAGDARAALRTLSAIASSTDLDEDEPDAIITRIARACGVALELHLDETVPGIPVEVEGSVRGVVRSRDTGDLGTVAAALAAGAVARSMARREHLLLTPVRSSSAALSQLLLCSQANLPAVAARASEVGLSESGWHCAVRLVVDDPAHRGGGTAELPQLEQEVLGLVAEHTGTHRSSWSVARPDDTVVLVRTTRTDPAREGPRVVREWIEELTSTLRETHPGLRVHVGIGTAHEGPSGLRASAEESRTALAAARLDEADTSIVTFDALGGRRMLAEWVSTDAAREAVRDLLAPLDALGPAKSATAVATLHAYLDERGSLQRAAARLHVHRNAVVYRMDGITNALGLDLSEPDIRFALQMACRARLMSTGAIT